MGYAEKIIQRFGGVRKTAEALSTPDRRFPPTTVQYWKDSGIIHPKWHPDIVAAGRRNGFDLTQADFSVLPEDGQTATAQGAAA